MKRALLCLFVLLAYFFTFGQEDGLDNAFDDGRDKKNLPLRLGLDAFTFAGGTPNLHLGYQPIDRIGLEVGLGFTPFPWLGDILAFAGDPPQIDLSPTGGMFISARISVHYMTEFLIPGAFSIFSSFKYKQWFFSSGQDYQVNRSKYCLGLFGYEHYFADRLGYTFRMGFFMCRDKMTRSESAPALVNQEEARNYWFDPGDVTKSETFFGLDIGFDLNFKL